MQITLSFSSSFYRSQFLIRLAIFNILWQRLGSREFFFFISPRLKILNFNRYFRMRKYVTSIYVETVENNSDLMEELLEYEIESILLNRSRDIFAHHQRITAVCDAFYNVVSSHVKKERAQKHDYMIKINNNATLIADITSEIKDVQNETANLALQQKVLDKQINNIVKRQEELREEIKEAIRQEENYTLEIVDLEQELEESKLKKKLKWDGIKRANNTYKSALQFRIQITDFSEACDKIRIIFFAYLKDEKPEYYVDLTRTADLWKVDLIHPSLKPKHEEQLKYVVNFKKQEISDITAFLCILRMVFKQHCKS